MNKLGELDGRSSATGSASVIGVGNQLLSDGAYRYAYDNEGNRTLKYVDADSSGTLNAGDTDVTAYAWDYCCTHVPKRAGRLFPTFSGAANAAQPTMRSRAVRSERRQASASYPAADLGDCQCIPRRGLAVRSDAIFCAEPAS